MSEESDMGELKRRIIKAIEPTEEPPMEVLGWVPVDEKPPEIGRRVLGLWMSHKGAVQSVRGAIGGWIDDDGGVTAPPTHWMPLPPEPLEVTT